jgi:hypothetical protein
MQIPRQGKLVAPKRAAKGNHRGAGLALELRSVSLNSSLINPSWGPGSARADRAAQSPAPHPKYRSPSSAWGRGFGLPRASNLGSAAINSIEIAAARDPITLNKKSARMRIVIFLRDQPVYRRWTLKLACRKLSSSRLSEKSSTRRSACSAVLPDAPVAPAGHLGPPLWHSALPRG